MYQVQPVQLLLLLFQEGVIVIPSDGRVETRAVTRSEYGAAAATITLLAVRPNVAVITQDQNGVTCAYTLESRKVTMPLGMFLLRRWPFGRGSSVIVGGIGLF